MAWYRCIYPILTFVVAFAIAIPTTGSRHKVQVNHYKSAAATIPLSKAHTNTASSKHLLSQRITNFTTSLAVAESGNSYAVDIQLGDQSFSVLFDTGSSDLWLPSANFRCIDPYTNAINTGGCDLGPTFEGNFSGGMIPNQNFNITYGDGEFLTGVLGYETVTLAEVTVENQEVVLVDSGYWLGDGVTSGLIGFAYPLLTSAFEGNDPTKDNPNTTAADYNPFFFSAIYQGSIDPVFSLIIERSSSSSETAGQLALGGLPSIAVHTNFTNTALEVVQLNDIALAATQFSYYTICIDGVVIGPPTTARNTTAHKANSKQLTQADRSVAAGAAASKNYIASLKTPKFISTANNHQAVTHPTLKLASTGATFVSDRLPVIVDSGTTLIYLPDTIAQAINLAYDPPGYFSYFYGVWLVDCNARAPDLAIRIEGIDFWINEVDMLVVPGGSGGQGRDFCLCGVQPGDPGPYILGDVFFKNVVAVFDVGSSQMSFAPHTAY